MVAIKNDMDQVLAERKAARARNDRDSRKLEALEGIFDELTKIRYLQAMKVANIRP